MVWTIQNQHHTPLTTPTKLSLNLARTGVSRWGTHLTFGHPPPSTSLCIEDCIVQLMVRLNGRGCVCVCVCVCVSGGHMPPPPPPLHLFSYMLAMCPLYDTYWVWQNCTQWTWVLHRAEWLEVALGKRQTTRLDSTVWPERRSENGHIRRKTKTSQETVVRSSKHHLNSRTGWKT